MYRINLLQRPTLIVPDEVQFHAATDNNVDARQILQNIIVAEERIIAPALGDALYEDLLQAKNKEVTTANQDGILAEVNASFSAAGLTTLTQKDLPPGTIINALEFVTDVHYKALWQRFLWKLTAEAVDMMCIVPSWLRHTVQGQQKNNPEVIGGNGQGSASGDRRDVQFKIDIWMQDRIDPLRARMEQWMCSKKMVAGSGAFTKYTGICESGDQDGISFKRKTDWVFGAYDTPCSSGCGCSNCGTIRTQTWHL
jgi:hypothetical protein